MIPGHLPWANEATFGFFPLHIHVHKHLTFLFSIYIVTAADTTFKQTPATQQYLFTTPLALFFLMSISPSDDLQADIAELESLIAMTTRPNILQTLEKLRNNLHKQRQDNMPSNIRNPIQRTKVSQ